MSIIAYSEGYTILEAVVDDGIIALLAGDRSN